MSQDESQSLPGVQVFEPDLEVEVALAHRGRSLPERLEHEARSLGFARLGVTGVNPLELGRQRLELFRASGYAGEMEYLEQQDRHDPKLLFPEVRSVVVVLLSHGDPDLVPLRTPRSGTIARYALGEDYHLVMKVRLRDLGRRLANLLGRPIRGRVCVDTAPLLERELAGAAGLGFQGKSTLLIAPGIGSYCLLGELLVDVELTPTPRAQTGCGSCRACLDACPTQAFPEAYQLDARRCVSYLTIEHSGPLPRELRRAIGNRVFGCDVCQEVCPYNASPSRPRSSVLGLRPALGTADLLHLLQLGSAAYRKLVSGTALRRASRTTLQRNAAVALGNSGDPEVVAPLAAALLDHKSPLVRAHVAWALGELSRYWDARALEALEQARDADPEPSVREEARLSLARGPEQPR